MSLVTTDLGLTTYSAASEFDNIYAAPPDYFARQQVVLTSATDTWDIGQVFNLSTTVANVQKYTAVANNTAFQALTSEQVGVLTHQLTQTAGEVTAVLQLKGNFIKSRLTPSDISVGSYFHGNIVITDTEDY